MNILLIEPDKILGDASKQALKQSGYKVAVYDSAQSALDSLDASLPDIIILEPQLGIHNGIEFLYEMRSYPEWQDVPVIVHTLNAHILDERFIEPLKQLGVSDVFYKPRTSLRQLVQAAGRYAAVT